jgi:hypothetical protein
MEKDIKYVCSAMEERPLGGTMTKILRMGLIGFICMVFLGSTSMGEETDPSKLLVVWTSGDRDVAMNMVFMYTYNAKKNDWWKNIRFLIWGPSSKLLSEDKELQQELQKMKEVGIELLACKACADRYGVSENLQRMGVEVKYMGVGLTEMLKGGWTTITF